MKKYAVTILLWISLLYSEIHTLFEGEPVKYENWIIAEYVPMPLQQNVKIATDEGWFIFIFAIMYVALVGGQNNRINRTTVKAFIWFCVMDAILYFYNYKGEFYGFNYTFLMIVWILIYNRDGKRIRTTNRQGTVAKVEWGN